MNTGTKEEYKAFKEAQSNFSRERGYAVTMLATFDGLGKETLKGRALRNKIRKAKRGKRNG